MKSKISVFSSSRVIEIFADDEKNLFRRNGNEYNFETFAFNIKLKNIIRNWPDKLVDNSVMDATSYEIKLKDGDKVYKKVGAGKLPANFGLFMDLISRGFDD